MAQSTITSSHIAPTVLVRSENSQVDHGTGTGTGKSQKHRTGDRAQLETRLHVELTFAAPAVAAAAFSSSCRNIATDNAISSARAACSSRSTPSAPEPSPPTLPASPPLLAPSAVPRSTSDRSLPPLVKTLTASDKNVTVSSVYSIKTRKQHHVRSAWAGLAEVYGLTAPGEAGRATKYCRPLWYPLHQTPSTVVSIKADHPWCEKGVCCSF